MGIFNSLFGKKKSSPDKKAVSKSTPETKKVQRTEDEAEPYFMKQDIKYGFKDCCEQIDRLFRERKKGMIFSGSMEKFYGEMVYSRMMGYSVKKYIKIYLNDDNIFFMIDDKFKGIVLTGFKKISVFLEGFLKTQVSLTVTRSANENAKIRREIRRDLKFLKEVANLHSNEIGQLEQEGNHKDDKLDEFKTSIGTFIEKMKEIPDWYQVVQKRGNAHAMFAKSMGIKVDDYEYWAIAHKEEYMMKYNEGNLDIEDVKLRIEKFRFIVDELEKVIKKAAELKLNITHEMHNDYCAARASLLGAERTLSIII